MTLRLLLPAFLLLSACAAAPLRMIVPPAATDDRVAIGFATLEVLDVSLPAYAEGEEIFVEGAGGALSAAGGAVWADDPARALTLDLVRGLSLLTGARVAPEPWPFEERAEARLDVRVAEIVATEPTAGPTAGPAIAPGPDAAGAFVLRGQYFVGAQDGSGRDRSREFRVAVPLPPGAGPAAIAAARGQATLALAREIAAEGLR